MKNGVDKFKGVKSSNSRCHQFIKFESLFLQFIEFGDYKKTSYNFYDLIQYGSLLSNFNVISFDINKYGRL